MNKKIKLLSLTSFSLLSLNPMNLINNINLNYFWKNNWITSVNNNYGKKIAHSIKNISKVTQTENNFCLTASLIMILNHFFERDVQVQDPNHPDFQPITQASIFRQLNGTVNGVALNIGTRDWINSTLRRQTSEESNRYELYQEYNWNGERFQHLSRDQMLSIHQNIVRSLANGTPVIYGWSHFGDVSNLNISTGHASVIIGVYYDEDNPWEAKYILLDPATSTQMTTITIPEMQLRTTNGGIVFLMRPDRQEPNNVGMFPINEYKFEGTFKNQSTQMHVEINLTNQTSLNTIDEFLRKYSFLEFDKPETNIKWKDKPIEDSTNDRFETNSFNQTPKWQNYPKKSKKMFYRSSTAYVDVETLKKLEVKNQQLFLTLTYRVTAQVFLTTSALFLAMSIGKNAMIFRK